MIITMTTVGYGDYFTMNAFGDISTIIFVFIGALLMAVYVIILTSKLHLEPNELSAFFHISEEEINKQYKMCIVEWISCLWKIKKQEI